MSFQFLLEYVQLRSYQSMLHLKHSHTKQSNEFLLIRTNQDLLSTPHPLF